MLKPTIWTHRETWSKESPTDFALSQIKLELQRIEREREMAKRDAERGIR